MKRFRLGLQPNLLVGVVLALATAVFFYPVFRGEVLFFGDNLCCGSFAGRSSAALESVPFCRNTVPCGHLHGCVLPFQPFLPGA